MLFTTANNTSNTIRTQTGRAETLKTPTVAKTPTFAILVYNSNGG